MYSSLVPGTGTGPCRDQGENNFCTIQYWYLVPYQYLVPQYLLSIPDTTGTWYQYNTETIHFFIFLQKSFSIWHSGSPTCRRWRQSSVSSNPLRHPTTIFSARWCRKSKSSKRIQSFPCTCHSFFPTVPRSKSVVTTSASKLVSC